MAASSAQPLPQASGGGLDGLHPVVEVIYLAAPAQLPADGLGHARASRAPAHRSAPAGGPWGGSSMVDMSRMPDRAMFSVRGMGVADRVSTSTCRARSLSRSLWVTPKRCSSSMTSSPRSLKLHVLLQKLVGADQQVHLSRSGFGPESSRTWAAVRNRESTSMFTGKARNRFTAVA